MQLQKYALIAEIVSAAAVTLSLVFVGLQIRDNTISNEAATFQQAVGYDLDILTSAGSSPATARIYFAYRDNPDSLSGDELLQGQALFTGLARHVENLYLQHQAGMVSEAGWVAREPFVEATVMSPGFGKLMSTPSGRNFAGNFIEYANELRAEGRLPVAKPM